MSVKARNDFFICILLSTNYKTDNKKPRLENSNRGESEKSRVPAGLYGKEYGVVTSLWRSCVSPGARSLFAPPLSLEGRERLQPEC